MKKTQTSFFLSICLLALTVFGMNLSAQISVSDHNISVNTDFNSWNGTMPNGFTRSANNNYMGNAPSNAGGVYSIFNMGFGYQPSSNQSATTTMVTGTFRNDTGSAITELKITYDAFKIVHRDSRNPCWTVNVSSGVFGTNLNWCSNETNTTKTFTAAVSIAEGSTFTVTFNSDRGSGSQSSPMIGFNNVSVESIKEACVTPDAPLVDPQFFCGGATVYDLFADGENIKWYDSQNATTALPIETILETGIYYVTQTVNGCESNKVSVAIDVTEAPEAPVAEAQTFCGNATVADLVPFGNGTAGLRENFNVADHNTFMGVGNQGDLELSTGTWKLNNSGIINNQLNLNGFIVTPVLTDVDSIKFTTNNPQNHIRVLSQIGNAEPQLMRVMGVVGNQVHTFPTNLTGEFQIRFESTNPNSPINIDYIEFGTAEQTTINWFDSLTAITPLTAETQLQTGTYYVSQSNALGCESPRTPVEITVNDIPTAPVAAPQSFCGTAAVSDLIPSVLTDRNESFDLETERLELPAGQHNFDLEWTVVNRNVRHICDANAYEGCAVRLYSNFPPLKGSIKSPVFEGIHTVSFYAKRGTQPNPTLRVSKLVNGVETVLQDFNLINVTEYTLFNVDVNENEDAQIVFIGQSGDVNLDNVKFNEAITINWYNVADGGTPLSAETELSTGTYYVSKSRNGCESARTPVEITVNEIPAAPVAEAQAFCGTATVADLVAEGTNLAWFDAIDATEALTEEIELTTGTYYVSQTANDCTSERTAVEVTVNEIPAAPVAEAQDFCGIVTIDNLVAEGTNLTWYATQDSTEALTNETELTSGTYYVTQSTNDCTSERTAVEITVNEIPAAPIAEAQDFCGTATVADLVAEGTNIAWYASEDSTEALTEETQLNSGTYYVEQSANDCVSERTAVEITVNEIPAAPTAEAQDFCGTATVADLVAEGTNLAWYATEDATEALTDETELTSGTYYVAQSSETCESERVAVEITINEVLGAPEAQDQSFCGEATVADLVAGGTNLAWYATQDATEELTSETELTSGTYYVSQSSETCESVRIPIEVTINEIPDAPLAFAIQEFEEGATLADLDVEGENLTWYDEEGNILDPNTPLVDGEIYYVTQTVNGCESEKFGIEAQALGINESDFANFNYYPNPVKNILHISNKNQIDNVLVFNLSGQLILEKKVNAKSVELNLSHLASATYVVKIVSNNQIKTVKVIKK